MGMQIKKNNTVAGNKEKELSTPTFRAKTSS